MSVVARSLSTSTAFRFHKTNLADRPEGRQRRLQVNLFDLPTSWQPGSNAWRELAAITIVTDAVLAGETQAFPMLLPLAGTCPAARRLPPNRPTSRLPSTQRAVSAARARYGTAGRRDVGAVATTVDLQVISPSSGPDAEAVSRDEKL